MMLRKALSYSIGLMMFCSLLVPVFGSDIDPVANHARNSNVQASRTETQDSSHAAFSFTGFKVLYTFTGGTDGVYPFSGLLFSSNTLYGTTGGNGGTLAGSVFKLDSSGTLTTLHTFDGGDGRFPQGAPFMDSAGNIYGTTSEGGTGTCNPYPNCGVLYEINAAGTFSVLHDFAGTSTDVGLITTGLTQDSAGNFYGEGWKGGANGGGAIFKWNGITMSDLYSGFGLSATPTSHGVLTMDSAGNLYGAAVNGSGTANQGYIYKIDPLGNETTLYNFQGGTTDGCHPQDAPVFDTAGNLYGVTEYCGTDNQGTVWKLSPSGEITILYNFTGGPDGGLPYSGVVLDVFGNLYGVTLQGGDSNGDGVLYEVSTGGTETVLHTFSKATDGAGLFAPVTLGSDGDLYGVSNDGGADGYGTIWGYALVPAGNELAVTLAGTGSGTVTSSPAGINCPGTCTAQFSSGTKVTLTENPASGSKFGGWSGACSGTSSCSVTVKGAVAVTATFTSLKQATTTTLSSSLNPSSYWQSVTFTAKVSAASGTPTGTVTFYGGTTSLGTGTLSGGTATYSTDALPPGSSSITAVYGGDSTNAGSTSSVLSQTVSEANTTTTLTSSQNPSSVGQSVTFTAAVAGQYGGTPTGSVAFYDGTTSLGTEALTSGTAACTTSSLAAGTHSITASYSGDSNYNVSTSAALSQVVKSATTVATKTALKSSENPSLYGASVTFTATVTSTSGTPAGIVTFYDKTTSLGTETLNGSGVATYSTSALVAGKHTIKAVYAGSSQYKTSSKALAQNVQAATTTMLKSSANPSTAGEKVTFTATVTAASGKPTGSVKFYDGTTLLGSGKLNGSGGATYSTSTLASAKHTIKATYAGTTTYKTSSAILTQTVE